MRKRIEVYSRPGLFDLSVMRTSLASFLSLIFQDCDRRFLDGINPFYYEGYKQEVPDFFFFLFFL